MNLLLSAILVVCCASLARADDAPTFQGLTADQWSVRLGEKSTRAEASAALATGGADALAVLDAMIRDGSESAYLPMILEALPDARPLVPTLLDLLRDRDGDLRRWTAWALSRIGPAGAAAVPALVQALRDPDPDVADAATAALGSIGAAAVPALADALADPLVRRRAADALGRVGPDASSAVDPLRALLRDTAATWAERVRAADALGEIRSRAAVPDLARGLADPEESIRERCARALGTIGIDAASAAPALLDVIETPDEPARKEATQAIWRIGEPAIRLLVDRFRTSGNRALLGTALAAGRRDAFPYLLPLLADRDAAWHEDAEAALALIGWEALCALPPDHPSAARVGHLVLTEGVVRRVRTPARYRAIAAPPGTDPMPSEATWETGSGHGFTLALHRGRWTADGLEVRAITYAWRRPRRVGERESETVAVRTTTIPRARAEAMLRMVLATTRVTIEEKRQLDRESWSSSNDFHVLVALRAGDTATYEEQFTGYHGSRAMVAYARVNACADILGEGLETCDWAETQPSDEDRAVVAARVGRIAGDGWWVRERVLLIANAIGDERCREPLEAYIASDPDTTPRDHRYAINAYARICGIDLRPTPFRDEDVAATRLRYLAYFAERHG